MPCIKFHWLSHASIVTIALFHQQPVAHLWDIGYRFQSSMIFSHFFLSSFNWKGKKVPPQKKNFATLLPTGLEACSFTANRIVIVTDDPGPDLDLIRYSYKQ